MCRQLVEDVEIYRFLSKKRKRGEGYDDDDASAELQKAAKRFLR